MRVPSHSTANLVRPRRRGSAWGSVSTTKEARNLPAASLTTVTEDGTEGSQRDHFTLISPILGKDSLPPAVILQRALAVNRMAWRWSLRDVNRGGPTPAPARSPFSDAKKLAPPPTRRCGAR
jgi:hypothetical protein